MSAGAESLLAGGGQPASVATSTASIGIHSIVTLEKQLLNMIGTLVYLVVELYYEVTIGYHPRRAAARRT
jgi:hypothetical protein